MVSGSTTLLEVANAWAEDFMAKFGGSITVNGGGSGEGIKSLIDGTTDLANASRSMKDYRKAGSCFKRNRFEGICSSMGWNSSNCQ